VSALPAQSKLELPYRWNGADGLVRMEIGVNDDPDRYGGEDIARGFPFCRATIDPPALGYREMIGWIQVVERSDHDPGHQIDLFEPLGDVPHPFAFFGFSPTLFDSPHTDMPDWDFAAHTFLCGLGGKLFEQTEGERREVRAVLGFAWGFSKRGDRVESTEPKRLSAEDWDGHLSYLRGRFPKFTFPPGFFDHPLP
jgi:hypothetical protein